MEYDLGEMVVEMPDEATPEQVRAAVAKYRASPAFEQSIDKTTGAAADVREAVGSSQQRDRLANLRRFHPDAVHYGDDNFVFTDPGSGRPTLYNPAGLDVGDVASVTKEAFQAVGSGMGATAGAFAGAALGIPTGPGALITAGTGAALGAGMGQAATTALYDAAYSWLHGGVDSRPGLERALDTVAEFALGATGQRIGEVVGEGLRNAAGGARSEVQRLVSTFERLGITPPASAVSGSKATQTVAKALESSPFSADVMQRQAEAVVSQTKAAAERIVAQFGQAQTKQGAGGTIKDAAAAAVGRFEERQHQLYEDVFTQIGPDTPAGLASVKALRMAMEGELSRAPQSLDRALTPAMNMLRSLEMDAANGGVPFAALRQVRTMIGRDIDSPILAGSTGAQNEALKRIYGAITEDLSAAAATAGSDVAQALQVADRYTRFFMQTAAKTMNKISSFDADEKAFDFAMSSARDGGTAIGRLRRHFEPAEWDTVSATVLHRIGQARPGAQDATGDAFSVSTFLTNWNKLAPEAKTALFGGNRYAEMAASLDDLVTVVSSLKDVEKLTNTSNTARAMFTLSILGALGSSAGAAVGGSAASAGTGALGLIGSAMSSRAAAKLITSPKFVQWLASAPATPDDIPAHMARLWTVAEATPAIRDEIGQFLQALRPSAGQPVPAANQPQPAGTMTAQR